MFDATTFALFLTAAAAIAFAPGPGMLFVLARTTAEGHAVGLFSAIGTTVGGLVHVAAGAIGVSALIVASAEAFVVVKLAGAAYLVWLGIKTIRSAAAPEARVGASTEIVRTPEHASRRQLHAAFRDGVWVEALNPKTAFFFLAFLPQFIDPTSGSVWLQFVVLGAISVALNTLADVCVVVGAGRVRQAFTDRPALRKRLQQASGGVLVSLGVSIAATGRT